VPNSNTQTLTQWNSINPRSRFKSHTVFSSTASNSLRFRPPTPQLAKLRLAEEEHVVAALEEHFGLCRWAEHRRPEQRNDVRVRSL
jgi:hypothetical protein